MLFRRLSSARATVGILAVCLALTWAAPCSAARVAKPDILRNDPRQDLALHKPYHVYPAPNYSLCTGASDAKDLTDGLFTDGYFWTQQTTVGWQRVVSSTVIIDLGAVQPIRALACRGPAGGRAGVYAIDRVEYYVGDDGDNFYLAGVAENPGLAEDGKQLYFHTFTVDNLRAGGRYVMARFYVGSKSTYVFTDEIVVRKGDFDPTGAKPTGKVLRRRDVLLEQQQIRADTFTLAGAPETPHVRWGKPLAGGRLKVIWVGPNGDMRPAIELAERLDMDMVPAPHFVRHRTSPMASAAVECVLRNLPDADVLVISGLRRASVPESLKKRVMERVRQGMGVIVQPWGEWNDSDVFDPLFDSEGKRTKPFGHAALTAIGQARGFRASGKPVGKGRFLQIDMPAITRKQYDAEGAGSYEYPFSAYAHAIAWAAGRDLNAIAGVEVKGNRATVRLGKGAVAKIKALARGRYFDARQSVERSAGPDRAVTIDLPGLEHGPHILDVWALDAKGGVLDWTSASFSTQTPAFIDTIELDKSMYEQSDPVRATVSLSGPTTGAALEAELSDCFGRVLERTTIDARGAAICVTLPKQRCLTLSLDLTLRLTRNGRLLDERRQVVWVNRHDARDFEFLGWYLPHSEPYARYAMDLFRTMGLKCLATCHPPWVEGCARENVRPGYENLYRVGARVKGNGVVRIPSLTDPAFLEQVDDKLREHAEAGRLAGLRDVSMGDESGILPYGSPNDYDQSPSALAAFREFLKGEYKTVEALNREWGSNFRSFSQATPWTRAQAKGQANPARWVDHRIYMENYFSGFHGRCLKEIRKIIPAARVGLSGTPNPNSYSGHDWYKVMKNINHISSYGGVQQHLIRSFKSPDTFMGRFNGYQHPLENSERSLRAAPWEQAFKGAAGVNFYTLISASNNNPIVYSDLSPTINARFFSDEVMAIQAGPGKLMMTSARENDGIAILYSQPSLHVATHVGLMNVSDRAHHFVTNMDCWCSALEAVGLSFDFVAAPQLAEGVLSKYHTLILPWSSAISDQEVAAVRRFVEAGGVVVADTFCGVRDEHGKPRATPALDDLFGVEQTNTLPTLEWETLRWNAASANVCAGAGASVRGGKAMGRLGRSPAVIVRRAGRGRAIFLNASISNYGLGQFQELPDGRLAKVADKSETDKPLRDFIRALVRMAGVKPDVTLQGADGEEMPSALLVRFRDGDATYIGAVDQERLSPRLGPIDPKEGRRIVLNLAKRANVYNSRTGEYLGAVDRFEVTLVPGKALFFAALPYRTQSMEVKAAPMIDGARHAEVSMRLATASATQADAQRAVFHVTVARPNGEVCAPYSMNVVADDLTAQTAIPFALNDAPGIWTVRAKDVASGVTGQTTVTLK